MHLQENKFIKIKGIKTSKKSNYNWPWNNKISLQHIRMKNKRIFHFDIKKMIGDYHCDDFSIVDDVGSFVILNMKC